MGNGKWNAFAPTEVGGFWSPTHTPRAFRFDSRIPASYLVSRPSLQRTDSRDEENGVGQWTYLTKHLLQFIQKSTNRVMMKYDVSETEIEK